MKTERSIESNGFRIIGTHGEPKNLHTVANQLAQRGANQLCGDAITTMAGRYRERYKLRTGARSACDGVPRNAQTAASDEEQRGADCRILFEQIARPRVRREGLTLDAQDSRKIARLEFPNGNAVIAGRNPSIA